MKRTLFRLFNILMACVVLLSSTGFGLIEHTCQMRGKQKSMVVAFSDTKQNGCKHTKVEKNATSDDQQTILKKGECCQDELYYENVDTSSSLSQFIAKFFKVVTETAVASFVAVFSWLFNFVFADKSASVSAFAAPPSLSGRDILTLVQSLLI